MRGCEAVVAAVAEGLSGPHDGQEERLTALMGPELAAHQLKLLRKLASANLELLVTASQIEAKRIVAAKGVIGTAAPGHGVVYRSFGQDFVVDRNKLDRAQGAGSNLLHNYMPEEPTYLGSWR